MTRFAVHRSDIVFKGKSLTNPKKHKMNLQILSKIVSTPPFLLSSIEESSIIF